MKKLVIITMCAASAVLAAVGLTAKAQNTENPLLAANVEALSDGEMANQQVVPLDNGAYLVLNSMNFLNSDERPLNFCKGAAGGACFIKTSINANARNTGADVLASKTFDGGLKAILKFALDLLKTYHPLMPI